MGTFITTISIPLEQSDFCTAKGIKLSKITQKAIEDLMSLDGVNEKTLADMQNRIASLQATIGKQRDFIEAKGLMDSFLGL